MILRKFLKRWLKRWLGIRYLDESEIDIEELNAKLFKALEKGLVEEVKYLLDAGAEIDARDVDGRTPLMNAKTTEQMKLLIELGADVNIWGYDDCCGGIAYGGETPLMMAVGRNNIEQVKLLLAAGADVNAADANGYTALMLARTVEQTKLLLAAGADVNAADANGYTALMMAVGGNNIEQMKLLLAAGADVNAENDGGESALMMAAGRNNIEQVKLLLAAGADVNAKNNEGESALNYARDNEVRAVLEEAIEKTAQADVKKYIEKRKSNVLKGREICKKKEEFYSEQISEAGITDKVVDAKNSSKENRTIMPEARGKLANKNVKELVESKGRMS